MKDYTIKIYFWNQGKKTLAYSGSVLEYLKQKGVKMRKTKSKEYEGIYTFNYSFNVGTHSVKFQDRQTIENWIFSMKKVVNLYLTTLGYKSEFRIENLFVSTFNK